MDDLSLPEFLTLPRADRLFDCCTAVRHGEIAYYVIGGSWNRLRLADLRSWAAIHRPHRAHRGHGGDPRTCPLPLCVAVARLGCEPLREAVARGDVPTDGRRRVRLADGRAWIERHRVGVRG